MGKRFTACSGVLEGEPKTGWDVVERLEWKAAQASTVMDLAGTTQTVSHLARSPDPRVAMANLEWFLKSAMPAAEASIRTIQDGSRCN